MLALPLRLAFASAVLLVLVTSSLGQSANQKPDLPAGWVVVLTLPRRTSSFRERNGAFCSSYFV